MVKKMGISNQENVDLPVILYFINRHMWYGGGFITGLMLQMVIAYWLVHV